MATLQEQHNFCFPLRELANDKVKLVPFQVERHADEYMAMTSPHPEVYAFSVQGPYDSKEDYISTFVEGTSHQDKGVTTFAIIDKTRPESKDDEEGEMAGVISFMSSSAAFLSTEIGYVLIFPPYQRTHVASNAVGLMMHYALDSEEEGGLGLRRVQWRAHSENVGSIALAKRMGFEMEGFVKWHVLFKNGKRKGKVGNGKPLPPGSDPEDLWRDSVILSHCWDRWAEGGREMVDAAMNRARTR